MSSSIPMFGERRPKATVYTIEECASCSLKTKRVFQLGDYVYKPIGECSHCKGKTGITMIYSESVKPS